MEKPSLICIGAALVDETYQCYSELLSGTSNPAKMHKSAGGVARNIAHNLALLENNVEIITHFGFDADGNWLKEECKNAGIGINHSLTNNTNTGKYVAIISPNGELYTAAVSTQFENQITVEFLETKVTFFKTASLILMDCNLSKESLEWIINFSRNENIPCIIEPVSIEKAERLKDIDLSKVLLITPNMDELKAINFHQNRNSKKTLIKNVIEKGVQFLWVRNGKEGSEIFSKELNHKQNAPQANVIDSTGAGDAALAGWIHAWLEGETPEKCVEYGHAMAKIVLEVHGAINDKLNINLLKENL
ncbi:MAG: hypothetical protein C0595_00705 [Marinilabiliales bacterium]|nr:MAG: hypothetical protein C0595_00705 [Marinilabiliales bacterium]